MNARNIYVRKTIGCDLYGLELPGQVEGLSPWALQLIADLVDVCFVSLPCLLVCVGPSLTHEGLGGPADLMDSGLAVCKTTTMLPLATCSPIDCTLYAKLAQLPDCFLM